MTDIYYRDRAQMHAPKTREEIARAARDLADSRFSDHTISEILKLDVSSVRQMLGQRSS